MFYGFVFFYFFIYLDQEKISTTFKNKTKNLSLTNSWFDAFKNFETFKVFKLKSLKVQNKWLGSETCLINFTFNIYFSLIIGVLVGKIIFIFIYFFFFHCSKKTKKTMDVFILTWFSLGFKTDSTSSAITGIWLTLSFDWQVILLKFSSSISQMVKSWKARGNG